MGLNREFKVQIMIKNAWQKRMAKTHGKNAWQKRMAKTHYKMLHVNEPLEQI